MIITKSYKRESSPKRWGLQNICFKIFQRHIATWQRNLKDPLHPDTGHALTVIGPVATFHTPRLCGRNLQATRCVPGGKSRVKAVTLFLTPPFSKTPNEAKGGRPYKLLRLITLV